VLASLGLEEGSGPPQVEIWNKIDALDGEAREALLAEAERRGDAIPVSALTGEGIELLTSRVSEKLRASDDTREIALSASDGERLAWLHKRGQVVDQQHDGETTTLQVRLSDVDWARFQALQTDFHTATFAIPIIPRIDLRDRFLNLLDQLTLPVPVAQFKRHI
jgi:GTP-binding protein HflX